MYFVKILTLSRFLFKAFMNSGIIGDMTEGCDLQHRVQHTKRHRSGVDFMNGVMQRTNNQCACKQKILKHFKTFFVVFMAAIFCTVHCTQPWPRTMSTLGNGWISFQFHPQRRASQITVLCLLLDALHKFVSMFGLSICVELIWCPSIYYGV